MANSAAKQERPSHPFVGQQVRSPLFFRCSFPDCESCLPPRWIETEVGGARGNLIRGQRTVVPGWITRDEGFGKIALFCPTHAGIGPNSVLVSPALFCCCLCDSVLPGPLSVRAACGFIGAAQGLQPGWRVASATYPTTGETLQILLCPTHAEELAVYQAAIGIA
jgi:hypothetical protein